jgi:hypothetical protein
MAQMRKTPKYQSPSGSGKFIGTREADKAKELKRIKEGKPTYSGKPARSKSGASTVAAVAKRFGVTAREARDIATAVANVGALAFDKKVYANTSYIDKKKNTTKAGEVKKAIKDVGTQIKETGRAAATGKKGTTSGRKGLPVGEYPYEYFKGQKRK